MGELGKYLFATIYLMVVLTAHVQAQGQGDQACSHADLWKPDDNELRQILKEHRQWAEEWIKKRLSDEWVEQWAEHHQEKAPPFSEEWDAQHFYEEWDAQRSQGRAPLCRADLRKAQLNRTNLRWADLRGADLAGARLDKARLTSARLGWANLASTRLAGTNLHGADLGGADLHGADLHGADLHGADLHGVDLGGADLRRAQLKDATLAYADLTSATYAPASLPPATYVAGIKGLETVTFPHGEEIGLVQLRKLLQDGGLRDLERQATYAIERGNTKPSRDWIDNPAHVPESIFRFIAFDLTTAYGLRPGRALLILLVAIGIFGVIYAAALMRGAGGIYRVRPLGRLEQESGGRS